MSNEIIERSHLCCSADESADRTTHRSDDEKKKLINRLSRIEGQIRGIKNMVEKDAYCVDILTQSRHVHTCVAEDIREGKDETIDELMEILQKLMK